MKHLIVAILVIACILGVGIFEEMYAVSTINGVIDIANVISTNIADGDMATAKAKADTLVTYYDSRRKVLELLFAHNEFKDVPALLSIIKSNISLDKKDEAIISVDNLIVNMIHHKDIIAYSIENVL